MLKLRPSCDRLIFNMGIPIPGKTVFILRQGPGSYFSGVPCSIFGTAYKRSQLWRKQCRLDTIARRVPWLMYTVHALLFFVVLTRNWPFMRGIHRSRVPVNSPHKGPWRWALMFSFICAWTNNWVNNREAGDLRRHRCHYDVNVMM